jgi:hypothetical protein
MCKIDFASHVMKYAPRRFCRVLGVQANICEFSRVVHIDRKPTQAQFGLTTAFMRHNNYYISGKRYPDGQTRTARPKDAGAETYQHSQPTPGSRHRSSIQTESVLRCQRSSPGPLRDAAAAQHRGDVDSRCGRRVWGLAAHVLSGAESFRPRWPGWIVARSTWSQGWAQGDHRRSRLRSTSEGGRTCGDYCPVHSTGAGALRNYDPPAQSRAGAGAQQKKTPRSDLNTSFAAEAAETYEALRPHLVDPTGPPGATGGRAVLLRHGMVAWATALSPSPTSPATLRPPTLAPASPDIAKELVRFMASLILNSGKDRCYA